MHKLADYIQTEWGLRPHFRAAITFGREGGHRFSISLVQPCGTFEVGVCYCWLLHSVSINAGLLSLFVDWQRPYHAVCEECDGECEECDGE